MQFDPPPPIINRHFERYLSKHSFIKPCNKISLAYKDWTKRTEIHDRLKARKQSEKTLNKNREKEAIFCETGALNQCFYYL